MTSGDAISNSVSRCFFCDFIISYCQLVLVFVMQTDIYDFNNSD